ncbi:putative ribonuclease H protein [Vitis vinifera]|uniref:Putative ribonuclease H protein n=1 Tax=Vitis vinifera TaxID=29760 RepID=A0A438JNM5_VITVI|nr:putative ribonuclease H protein [Vitis vinifera]
MHPILWPKQLSSQEGFWVKLSDIVGLASPRWCVGGDFNVIRRSLEKLGGSRLTPSMKDFDDFISDCELIDLPLRSASFTWSNMQVNPVCKRLDRFLYSNEWEQAFPQSIQGVLPRWTSDHWPIVLETNPFKWGPTPFRFENMWLQHPSFKENFGRWWRESQGNGWEGHKFMRKLQFVKAKLEKSIKEEILRYFEKFYTSPSGESWRVEGLDWSPISGESAFRLESPFTEEEIFKAIFQMDRDKAPGPDGFTIAVFQDCWKVIKEDLVKVRISDFRPINLITSLYKIIAKVLAGRIREVLHETIHSTQGAFVQGRQILDAVLIANEIVDEKRRSGEEGVVFKIDFEKAYDHASRGLRQGDPLSPFLFTIVADVLSRMLLKVEERNVLEGFKVGRIEQGFPTYNLQMIPFSFPALGRRTMMTLKNVLLVFGHISGLKVNLDKSNIYGINLEQNHLSRLAEMLDCKASGWPILYLGLPLGGNPKTSDFWDPVIERISRRLDGWQKAYLSFGGRITLIQSCLTHMPCVGEGKRDHLVNWDVVCKPKSRGGLGFGKISIRNVALLGKWLWRYPREGSALWHQVILSIYGSHSNGWDVNNIVRWSHRCPWKAIALVYQEFSKFTRFVVEDLEGLMQSFDRLHISSSVPDKRSWSLSPSGLFTVKSFFLALSQYSESPPIFPTKFVWNAQVPFKVKSFVWLVAHKKVNTNDLLQLRRPYKALSPDIYYFNQQRWIGFPKEHL